jgi:hypothetical protein
MSENYLKKLREERLQKNLNRPTFISKCIFCKKIFEQQGYNKNGFKQRIHFYCSKLCQRRNESCPKLLPIFLYKFYLDKKLFYFVSSIKKRKHSIFSSKSRSFFGTKNLNIKNLFVLWHPNSFLRKKIKWLDMLIKKIQLIKRKKWRKKYHKSQAHLNNVKKWQKKQLKNSHYYLSKTLRSRIIIALKNGGIRKTSRTHELLGTDINTVWKHLESKFKPGMTRNNHGEWHIDHIIPCASFDLSDPKQQIKCFHYTNLQPLWAKENLVKSDKLL